MENDLFHVQRGALSNSRPGDIIAVQGDLHQLYQVGDVPRVEGSDSKLMVTGSDDPVTQRPTLQARPTLHITLGGKKTQVYLPISKIYTGARKPFYKTSAKLPNYNKTDGTELI